MSKVLVTEGHLNNIAEAIRAKNGASTTYRPGDMAEAIRAIPTGGITPTGTVNIAQNGTHDVTQYASANVNVQPNLQSKTATNNGMVTPDAGYDGLSSVLVNVSGGGGNQEIATFYGWFFNSGYSAFGTLVKRDGTIYGRVVNKNAFATFIGELFTLRCQGNGTTALVLTALAAISVTIYRASTSSSETTPMTGDSYQLLADETKSIPNPNYSGGLIITVEAV